jgi:hypothetical protein
MAGGNRMVIVTGNLGLVSTMAVDWREQMVYWGDSSKLRIEMADYNGTNRKVLVTNHRARSIVIFDTWLYYSDTAASMYYK